jgi:hypothetical protein
MKTVIHDTLTYSSNFDIEDTADVNELFDNTRDLCVQFSVHHTITVSADRVVFTIEPQKVTLNEIDMNTFWHDVLDNFFNIRTQYAAFGGAGCEFALSVYNA